MGPQKSLMVICPELLGDYFLIRNHLKYLRQLPPYNQYKIIYVGFAPVRPLFEYFDPDIADQFAWIQDFSEVALTAKKAFKSPLLLTKWRAIAQRMGLPPAVDEVWCPSLVPWLANGLVMATRAKRKVARDVAGWVLQQVQKRLYTELFYQTNLVAFSFSQSRNFFEMATQQSFEPVTLAFPTEKLQGLYDGPPLEKPYCLVFPDSQEDYKEWPPEAFAAVIRHLLQNTHLHVYLCGHGRRAQAGQAIIEALGDDPTATARVHNWMGQTSLLGILDLIAQSTFVMCNDSFALHAANATKTPVLCIALQTNLGRYLPYPEPFRASAHYYVFGALSAQRISDIPTAPVIAQLDQLCQAQGGMAQESAR